MSENCTYKEEKTLQLDPTKLLALRDCFGCVYGCACGTIHVAVGTVELKFDRRSLLETYKMLEKKQFSN